MLIIFEKRKTTLQEPNITLTFVTIPKDFIKKMRWIKGEKLIVELKKEQTIILKRNK